MKNHKKAAFLGIMIIIFTGLIAISCGGDDNPAHTCTFSNWVQTTAPTCIAKGIETGYCGCGLTSTRDGANINPDAHNLEPTENNSATCTESGFGELACTRTGCNHTEDGIETPALGHAPGNWLQTTLPTCTEDGIETGTCTRDGCNEPNEPRKGEDKLGHAPGNWLQTTLPTCAEDGVETGTCTRDGCNETNEPRKGEDKLGHAFSTIPATCTTASIPGTCTRDSCNEPDPEEVVQVLGHDHASSLICKRSGCDHQYALGDTGPAGGIIFYVDVDGFTMTDDGSIAYYLEAAPANMLTTLSWSTLTWQEYVDSGYNDSLWTDPRTETEIGTGRKNTALILELDPTAPAALSCDNYSIADFNDWFLPSIDELNQLYLRRADFGLSSGLFWSSSQLDIYYARFQDFGHIGGWNANHKYDGISVRPVRAF